MGGIQIEAREWEAGVKKGKLLYFWDVPDAETSCRKEMETFKLYFVYSEELSVEPWSLQAGRLSTFLPFSLY